MTGACLAATSFLDADHPRVAAFAREAAGDARGPAEKATRLYLAVRDGFRYDPYSIDPTRAGMRASRVVERGRGYCVTKAVLLAASARAVGVPARLGFADVKNHLASERLLRLMGTDVFHWHGYAELLLAGRWLKATPAFDRRLCERIGVAPLEFDGTGDSIFQAADGTGRKFMEYVLDRGTRDDLPFEELDEGMRRFYPTFFEGPPPGGDFEAEVRA